MRLELHASCAMRRAYGGNASGVPFKHGREQFSRSVVRRIDPPRAHALALSELLARGTHADAALDGDRRRAAPPLEALVHLTLVHAATQRGSRGHSERAQQQCFWIGHMHENAVVAWGARPCQAVHPSRV